MTINAIPYLTEEEIKISSAAEIYSKGLGAMPKPDNRVFVYNRLDRKTQ